MTRDQSKVLADLLAGLPDAVDYDAVHAALVATAGGRRFLAELTRRNRNADTHMVLGAIARVEATLRGDPAPKIPAIVTRELTEIAVAIDRLGAQIGTAKPPATNVFVALERIQDIAFVLHERPIEDSLCDALDAAVREIFDAIASAEAEPQDAPIPTELLRALSRRIGAMIALALESDDADLPSASEAVFDSVLENPKSNDEAIAKIEAAPPCSEPTGARQAVRSHSGRAADQEQLAVLRGLSEEELIALFS